MVPSLLVVLVMMAKNPDGTKPIGGIGDAAMNRDGTKPIGSIGDDGQEPRWY